MTITACIVDEWGKEQEWIDDPTASIGQLLARVDSASPALLKWIDPEGETVFNRLQAVQLIDELKALQQLQLSPAELDLAKRLTRAARRCKTERLYLRFRGD
ncbi:MAG: hypothetical protein NTV21_08790 [Planctomycetota bacterium]|nr:hypothetical protein [Planctomycetota bacterium]